MSSSGTRHAGGPLSGHGVAPSASGDSAALISSGRRAIERGAFEEARAFFETALAAEKTGEGYEALAEVTWRLGDAETAAAALESAYGLYSRQPDPRGAARVATALGMEFLMHRAESAVADGWLQRARRHLEGLEPSPEQAWLSAWEAHLALLYRSDFETGRRKIAEARSIAGPLRLQDVELLCLALEGVALVAACDVTEGMRRLDEVTAAAVGGEMRRIDAAGNATCYALAAYERLQDFDRAAQWFEKVRAWFKRSRFVPALTFCRDHMIGILLWRGPLSQAESEIEAMIRESELMAPRFVRIGLLRKGLLRHRQGRTDEAAEIFSRVDSEPGAWIGRAAIALERRDFESAVALSERYLRALSSEERLDRAPALGILARALAALGRAEEAEAALESLRELARLVPTEGMRGTLRAAEGAVALEGGDLEAARRRFEDAVHFFERAEGTFEAARGRVELARCLHSLHRDGEAEREARAALSIAEGIGAAGEAKRAGTLLAQIRPPKKGEAGAPAFPGLTERESEVLRLVAEGLSNAEIAGRLYLSEHTVKRHVANILSKLDLPSRAGAAAYAARQGAG